MTLKVGDKVRLTDRLPRGFDYQGHAVPGAKGTVVRLGSTFPYRVVVDGHYREHWVEEHEVEKIEEPTPKFKVGDRVRFKEDYNQGISARAVSAGEVGTVTGSENFSSGNLLTVNLGDKRCDIVVYAFRLEKVESVPFKLERGDKVVNRKTGRVGFVLGGWVHDDNEPIREPATVKAVEEYEEHFPGTYDLIKEDAPW